MSALPWRRHPCPPQRGSAPSVAWAWVALLALAIAACGGNDGGTTTTGATTPAPPETYVAVGASEAVGVGAESPVVESWPQVFYRTGLDPNTVFVNAAQEGTLLERALEVQVPVALELRPTLVTVWLNVNDLLAGVPVATYEQQLTELVRALRQDGQARVLLANTPPVDQLPALDVLEQLPAPVVFGDNPSGGEAALGSREEAAARVAEYNQAIERVANAEGAELVDLHTPMVEAAEDGSLASLVSEDGFNPSTEGHAAVADLFAAAL